MFCIRHLVFFSRKFVFGFWLQSPFGAGVIATDGRSCIIIAVRGMRVFDASTALPMWVGSWDYTNELIDDWGCTRNGGYGRAHTMSELY